MRSVRLFAARRTVVHRQTHAILFSEVFFAQESRFKDWFVAVPASTVCAQQLSAAMMKFTQLSTPRIVCTGIDNTLHGRLRVFDFVTNWFQAGKDYK